MEGASEAVRWEDREQRERERLVYRLILHYLPFTLLVGPSYKKLFAIYFVNA